MSLKKSVFSFFVMTLLACVVWWTRLPEVPLKQEEKASKRLAEFYQRELDARSLPAASQAQMLVIAWEAEPQSSVMDSLQNLYLSVANQSPLERQVAHVVLEHIFLWPQREQEKWFTLLNSSRTSFVIENSILTQWFLYKEVRFEPTADQKISRKLVSQLTRGLSRDPEEFLSNRLLKSDWTSWIFGKVVERLNTEPTTYDKWLDLVNNRDWPAGARLKALNALFSHPSWNWNLVSAQWPQWDRTIKLAVINGLYSQCPAWREAFLGFLLSHEQDEAVLKALWQVFERHNSKETLRWVLKFTDKISAQAPQRKSLLAFQAERMLSFPQQEVCSL